jgi:hypothetical protein
MTGTAHLSLTIDVDSDPISGSIANGTGVSRAFSGWIELVAVIEAARSEDSAASGERTTKPWGPSLVRTTESSS